MQTGVRLGPYEILSAIGAGGMGEVYRARDTKLNRDVAIKVLPDAVATDPERLARFQREAQVLAALNHPNIAHIYGLESQAGRDGEKDSLALVMELVEGPTLADLVGGSGPKAQGSGRTPAGALPLPEALNIARQIAEALEAAHEQGIIHRDLKPANVKVRDDGTVKVLDFGLAKMLERPSEAGRDAADVSLSPTITSPAMMTGVGVILGTAAYMSPEQARGRAVDRRADIWAFGAVLFEMLTGRQPFPGEDVSHVLARVIERDPDWTELPVGTPAALRRLVQRCLTKDPQQRLQAIGDARIELRDLTRGVVEVSTVSAEVSRVGWVRTALWTTGLVAATVLIGVGIGVLRRQPPVTPLYRASVFVSGRMNTNPFGRFALSPDGRLLAYVAAEPTGRLALWVRPLDVGSGQRLAGTDDATAPFWSPDNRSIAFFSGNKLKRIDVAGGQVSTICEALNAGGGGTWVRGGNILFSSPSGNLVRVPAGGGTPAPVTTLDVQAGERRHGFPSFLPDGRHFLYLALNAGNSPLGLYVGALDSQDRKRLLEGGGNAKYSSGSLVYLEGARLVAQRFDAERQAFVGPPVSLSTDSVVVGNPSRTGAFSLSDTGLLVYQAVASSNGKLVWYDRKGQQVGAVGDRADYADLNLSVDGRNALVSFPTLGNARDIWRIDVTRGLRQRLTLDAADEFNAIWSPDGSTVVFNSTRNGQLDLYQTSATANGREHPLLVDSTTKTPLSWSSDGRFILYHSVVGPNTLRTGGSLWALPLFGDRKPVLVIDGVNGNFGQFSPDSRFVAFAATNIGQSEVYVAPFPGPGRMRQVSVASGFQPRWRRDGKEIFFVTAAQKLMTAPISAQGGTVEVGTVTPLFDLHPHNQSQSFYDVSVDGKQFLVNEEDEAAAETSRSITLVINWPVLLKN